MVSGHVISSVGSTGTVPFLFFYVIPLSDVHVNTGSPKGLLPDGTKPLPEPIMTYDQWGIVAFTW